MRMLFSRSMVIRRPAWVVVFWVAAAGAMGFFAPNLTRLAAEGQASLLGGDAESKGASEALLQGVARPAYESLVVAALHRSGGLAAANLGYATRLAKRIGGDDRPQAILRVLGPGFAAGDRRAAAQQGRDGCARCRASVHLVRSPADSRGGRLAPVAGASRPARPSGRAGGALGG